MDQEIIILTNDLINAIEEIVKKSSINQDVLDNIDSRINVIINELDKHKYFKRLND